MIRQDITPAFEILFTFQERLVFVRLVIPKDVLFPAGGKVEER
jgi:hypothetical protein